MKIWVFQILRGFCMLVDLLCVCAYVRVTLSVCVTVCVWACLWECVCVFTYFSRDVEAETDNKKSYSYQVRCPWYK